MRRRPWRVWPLATGTLARRAVTRIEQKALGVANRASARYAIRHFRPTCTAISRAHARTLDPPGRAHGHVHCTGHRHAHPRCTPSPGPAPAAGPRPPPQPRPGICDVGSGQAHRQIPPPGIPGPAGVRAAPTRARGPSNFPAGPCYDSDTRMNKLTHVTVNVSHVIGNVGTNERSCTAWNFAGILCCICIQMIIMSNLRVLAMETMEVCSECCHLYFDITAYSPALQLLQRYQSGYTAAIYNQWRMPNIQWQGCRLLLPALLPYCLRSFIFGFQKTSHQCNLGGARPQMERPLLSACRQKLRSRTPSLGHVVESKKW